MDTLDGSDGAFESRYVGGLQDTLRIDVDGDSHAGVNGRRRKFVNDPSYCATNQCRIRVVCFYGFNDDVPAKVVLDF